MIFGIGSNFKNLKLCGHLVILKRKRRFFEKETSRRTLPTSIEKKKKYNQYKEYIDSVISQFESEEDDKRNEYMDKVREENKIHNQTCPNCGSKNTIQVFRRPKVRFMGL